MNTRWLLIVGGGVSLAVCLVIALLSTGDRIREDQRYEMPWACDAGDLAPLEKLLQNRRLSNPRLTEPSAVASDWVSLKKQFGVAEGYSVLPTGAEYPDPAVVIVDVLVVPAADYRMRGDRSDQGPPIPLRVFEKIKTRFGLGFDCSCLCPKFLAVFDRAVRAHGWPTLPKSVRKGRGDLNCKDVHEVFGGTGPNGPDCCEE